MPSRPYFRWFEADYMADTFTLSRDEDLLYRRLLGQHWRLGTLPTEPSELAKLARYPQDVFDACWPAVRPYFKSTGKALYQTRMAAQIRAVEREIGQKRQAAEARWSGLVERDFDEKVTSEKTHKNNLLHAQAFSPQCDPVSSIKDQGSDPVDTPSQESGSGGFAEFQSPPIHDLSREPPSGGICKGAFRENAPGAKPPKAGPKANGYAPDFEALWNAKPRRAGADDKRRAYRAWSARRTEGHEPATMLEGTIRYRAYCQAQDKEGTEYVMQTATFLGPSDPPHFLNRWDPPKPRAAEGNYERLARHFGWDQEGVTLEGEVDNGDNHEA